MDIIKTQWNWSGSILERTKTSYIVLHHAAADTCTAKQIDTWHKNNGWVGIGYHFFVTKDGEVYEGRPIDKVGAQCSGHNFDSIGICFEGDFTKSSMNNTQFKAGVELLKYVKNIYPKAEFKKHSDLFSTACPGVLFPFDEMIKASENNIKELTTVNDIVYELSSRNIITDKALWLKKLDEDKNAYWLAKKTIDYLIKKGE